MPDHISLNTGGESSFEFSDGLTGFPFACSSNPVCCSERCRPCVRLIVTCFPRVDAVSANYNERAISSFMISVVPPYIRCTRASAYMRAIGYSVM